MAMIVIGLVLLMISLLWLKGTWMVLGLITAIILVVGKVYLEAAKLDDTQEWPT